jgi:hypothetical protein
MTPATIALPSDVKIRDVAMMWCVKSNRDQTDCKGGALLTKLSISMTRVPALGYPPLDVRFTSDITFNSLHAITSKQAYRHMIMRYTEGASRERMLRPDDVADSDRR